MYAQWSLHSYSISYDLDGGSYPEGRSNPNSYTIETETFVLDNPEKAGYEFLGWTTSENGEPNKNVSIEKGTTGDLSFTAAWRPLNSYSVSYDANGGEGSIETTRKSKGESVEITSDSGISRKGYEFVCWNTSSDGSGTNYKAGDSYSEDADIWLYAQWEVVKYSISYDLAGGAMPDGKGNPLEYTIESDTFTLVNPERKGYVFEGWKEKDSSDKTAVENLSIEKGSFGNKSFTAVWRSASKYTVTFDANGADGGTAPPELIVYEGTSFTVPSYGSLYKDGYVFNGWNTKADGTGTTYVESESVEVRDDIVLYAIWKDGPFEFSYLPDSDSYSVVCKDEGVSAVIIPSEYKGKPVTHIGNRAFFGFSELNSVTISENITSIGDCAFVYCSSLTKLEIPQRVTNIGNDVFSCCSGLRSINVNSENTVYYSEGNCLIERDTRKLVLGCMNSVIPEDVTSIDSNAFNGCSGLTEITIPESVTIIGFYAFSNCSGLTGSLVIPEGVTSIEQGAFYGCSGLTSITIPESVKRIGNDVFSGCTGVKSVVLNNYVCMKSPLYSLFPSSYKAIRSVVMPLDVTSIGDYVFRGCSGLEEIVIPEGVTIIGRSVFSGCSGLKEIVIPESVTSIGYSAFYGCSGLTSITIPEGVTSIANWTFDGCTGLRSVVVNSYICSRRMSQVFPDSYKVIESVTIPEGVTSIGGYAFYNCSGLTSVTIPNSLTVIGEKAFCCSGLPSVTIPEGVTDIGEGAFSNCSGLTSVTIPSSVTHIGYSAFHECKNLSIVFADGTTEIPAGALSGASGVISVTIPEGVASIGNSAFSSCRKLESICYFGTKAQWNCIQKGSYWNFDTGDYIIHCTDGDLAKD